MTTCVTGREPSDVEPASRRFTRQGGDRVFVHGTITTDAWNDKDTGAKRTAQLVLAEIIAPSPDYPHPGQR